MYVGDERTIVNTNGLRCVTKTDHLPLRGDEWFNLRVFYKGQVETVRYETEAERDAMFKQISDAVCKNVPPGPGGAGGGDVSISEVYARDKL